MDLANLFAGAWKLTNYKLFSGRRILVTLVVFVGPVALIALAVFAPGKVFLPGKAYETYGLAIRGLFMMVLVPFVSIFWGSALLSDEIENKTLVYLWTRPAGRARLFVLQATIATGWLLALLAPSILLVYVVSYLPAGWQLVIRDIQSVLWDVLALGLGGFAYIALGYLASSLLRKPLAAALMYVFSVDALCQFLPHYLKRLSIRHYIYTLSSNPQADKPTGMFAFLAENTTTATQAVLTLLCVAAVMLALGSYFLRRREFAGDDPARAQ